MSYSAVPWPYSQTFGWKGLTGINTPAYSASSQVTKNFLNIGPLVLSLSLSLSLSLFLSVCLYLTVCLFVPLSLCLCLSASLSLGK
jgi:hypothetical protein